MDILDLSTWDEYYYLPLNEYAINDLALFASPASPDNLPFFDSLHVLPELGPDPEEAGTSCLSTVPALNPELARPVIGSDNTTNVPFQHAGIAASAVMFPLRSASDTGSSSIEGSNEPLSRSSQSLRCIPRDSPSPRLLHPVAEASSPDLGSRNSAQWIYSSCSPHRWFHRRHQLNTHAKKHSRPFICPMMLCESSFRYKKDLTRHVNSKHPGQAMGSPVRFLCPFPDCKRSSQDSGFPRNDSLQRHISFVHHSKQLRQDLDTKCRNDTS